MKIQCLVMHQKVIMNVKVKLYHAKIKFEPYGPRMNPPSESPCCSSPEWPITED